jgi:NAD-dependent deacetylase sirtuin 4
MGLTDLIRAFSEKSSERPDGDIEIKHEQADRFYNEFRVSVCLDCQKGQMRPDVVFFGENIEQSIAEKSYQLVDNAGSLLIVGTSLATWSSYRLAVRAKERNLPICIINHGPTRADQISSIKIDGLAGMILPRLVEEISR